MQNDNRGVDHSLVGFLYLHDGVMIRVSTKSWSLESYEPSFPLSKHLSYWRRTDGVWENIMGDGDQADRLRTKRFNEVYEEYISEILEKQ